MSPNTDDDIHVLPAYSRAYGQPCDDHHHYHHPGFPGPVAVGLIQPHPRPELSVSGGAGVSLSKSSQPPDTALSARAALP